MVYGLAGTLPKALLASIFVILITTGTFYPSLGNRKAVAAAAYTSLTYSVQVSITVNVDYTTFSGQHVFYAFTTALALNSLTLNGACYVYGCGDANDIQGTGTAQGTVTITNSGSITTCPAPVSGTYGYQIVGYTIYQTSLGLAPWTNQLDNLVWTASGCDVGYDLRYILNDCFGHGLGSGFQYTNQGCHQFPINGGTNTVAVGPNPDGYSSITGSAQLTLLSSTISSTSTTSTYSSSTTKSTTSTSSTSAQTNCLGFLITPTMPPASDPRAFTTGLGAAAFRFDVYWGALLPVKVAFQTAANNGINPSFTFNPVNMLVNPVNVIMDVSTNGVPVGTYPIDVTATANLPNSNTTCTATSQVSLVVGNTVADFTLMAHEGQVNITQVAPTPEGGPATLIKTGNSGTATLNLETETTSSPAASPTVDVGKNTSVRVYNHVTNVDDLLYEDMADIVWHDIQANRDPCLQNNIALVCDLAHLGWAAVHTLSDKVGELASGATKVVGCALASLDKNNHDACDGTGLIFISGGRVHYYRPGTGVTPQHLNEIFLGYHQIIIPLGTDLTVESQPYGNSSLTVLQGSAIVIDVISQQVQIVNASQRLDTTIPHYSANLHFSNGQSASLVLGQAGFTSAGSATSSSGLNRPRGPAFDLSDNLWIPDRQNNRILEFKPPFSNGMTASLVIGQSSFTASNRSSSQSGLNRPISVAFDSFGNLWAADTGNSRILEFRAPFATGMPASLVIGQPDFTSRVGSTTQSGLSFPDGIAFDPSGNLWVADSGNSRILEFTPPFSNGMAASLVIGEPDFTSSNFVTTQTGLSDPESVAFDHSGNLWVADSYNNRTLEFTAPFANGMSASLVVGQSSFSASHACAASQKSICSPVGVAFDPLGNLWVTDASDNRVVEFVPPFASGMAASLLIGQPDFTSAAAATSAGGLSISQGGSIFLTNTAFDPAGNLWVGDGGNNRILVFLAASSTSTASTTATAAQAQALAGGSWPTYNIRVYVPAGPALARQVAINAMKQWNYSQTWFQKSYSLGPRPIYNLIVSSDPASPITIYFNQTSGAGLSIYYYYYWDSSYKFTKVLCPLDYGVPPSLVQGPPTTGDETQAQNWLVNLLGSCLGLSHTTTPGDLANTDSWSNHAALGLIPPSTQNLYALYLLSNIHYGNQVPPSTYLPANIPYTTSPSFSSQDRISISNVTPDSIAHWWDSRLSYPVTVDNRQFTVGVLTNSTVSNFSFDKQQGTMTFSVSGVTGTKGYINATWPKSLLNGTLAVTMDGKQTPFSTKQNTTDTTLYLSYSHSQHTIVVAAAATSTATTTPTSTSTSASTTITPGTTTTSPTSTTSSTASTTSAPASTTTASTSASTSGGGGIPEFPFQILATTILTVVVLASYLVIRRRSSHNPGNGQSAAKGRAS